MAPGAGPTEGARPRANVDFPVPGESADRDETRRGGPRNPCAIARYSRANAWSSSRGAASGWSRAAVALVLARTAARHERNNGSNDRPSKSPVSPGNGSRRRSHGGEPTAPEIHEQKRQVVEDVGAGDLVVELDAVEERRPAVEQHDVAQVQVAVTLPHEPGARRARAARPGGRVRAAAVSRRMPTGSRTRRALLGESSALPSMTHAMPALPP